MAFKPTKEQELAIYQKGSIIVSAAAGSGKTAVLVERVAHMLCDKENPIMADKLLVVTFTNAAAAELRYRIEKRLNEEFDKSPDDILLQKQRILINNAKICTIDSFCIDFIKENFENSGISPAFKIADNPTLHSLERTAMSALINEYFDAEDEDFLKLLQFFGEDYDDSKLQKCVYQIFDFSRHMPFPDMWLDSILAQYRAHAENESSVWYDSALDAVEDIAVDAALEISQAIKYLELSFGAYEKYFENYNYFYETANTIAELCKDRQWDSIFEKVATIKAPACKRLSAEEKTETVFRSVELRDSAKKMLNKIKSTVYGTRAELAAEAEYLLPFVEKIVELVRGFEQKLYQLLSQQDMITFYIAEQTVLSMLAQQQNGKITTTDAAQGYIDKYDAILVDEYQDTNSLQDMLFNILSANGQKLFCVGDMKQCIYKFRGSNPLNFLAKKESAIPLEKRKPYDTLRVDLGCNFRSRPEICEFINGIFEKLLYRKNSDFDYDVNEKLVPMAQYPENTDTKVETHFIDYNSVIENSDVDLQARIYAEAHTAANIILETVNREPFLRDGDGLRKANFGDITILVRSIREKGEVFMRVLKERGIPVTVSSSDVLDSDEVQTLIALLRVINNPSDDISLLTVMTSPVFAFSMGELADIRGLHKYGSFISSVSASAKNGNKKAEDFLELVARLRRKNIVMPVGLLIDEIFEETNLLNIVSAMENGDIKRLNLLSVQNFANSFESDSRQDLRSFLNYFGELENRDFALSSESGDSVTVMTIHKSKGLQFPICILANTSNQFNQQDLRDSVITSEKYGFSSVYYNSEGEKVENTVLRTVMKHEEKKNLLAEELRVFYVALTRAEEKLIVLASYNDLDKEVEKKCTQLDVSGSAKKVEYSLFRKNISYADWLLEALLIDGHSGAVSGITPSENIVIHRELKIISSDVAEISADEPEPQNTEKLREDYLYQYPFAELLGLQSKSSVTELVHKADDKLYRFTRRPAFMQERGLSSAEKGTAVHKVMERADFSKCKTELSSELERLYENMHLTEAEYEAVDTEVLTKFFNSELCDRIVSSPYVKREMRFLTEFPAKELAAGLSDACGEEMIVVQGAVDLLFEEDGKIVIVDFKTDRNKDEAELLAAYSEQLKIYAKACSKLLKLPVGELIIYSFSIGKPIYVK